MKNEILTEELLTELQNRPLEDFVEAGDSANAFSARDLPDLLSHFLKEKDMRKNEVVHATNINQTHLYQIFSGDRGASRDKILQIALALGLDLRECDHLLTAAGVSSLYCKNRRDAIIIYAVEHRFSVDACNETLYKFNEDTLSD